MSSCCVMNCHSNPEFICACTKMRILICNDHWKQHLDLNPLLMHSVQLISKSPISSTKENILNLINSAMTEFFKEKSRLILESSRKIKEIHKNLAKSIYDIDKNISKCLDCYKKINETYTISESENLSENCLLNKENEGIYIMLCSMFKEPYEQLSEVSKKSLRSKFDNIYLNYENHLIQLISSNKNSIASVEKLLCAIDKDPPNKKSASNIILMEKKIESEYSKAQKELNHIQEIFSHNEIAGFIYKYNKDIENKYKEIKNNFKNISKTFFSKTKDIDSYYVYSKLNDKYICTFDNWKSNNLTIFNTETHKEVTLNFKYATNLNRFTCFIPIEKYKIYCCGDYNYEAGSMACIINIKKMSIKELPSKSVCKDSGGICYKNQIFLFGGENKRGFLRNAEKYDLKSKKWKNLASLPHHSTYCSCSFFNSKILITGKMHERVYSYDMRVDSYSEIFRVGREGQKILATLNKRVYLFEIYGVIYESEIGNEYKWKNIGESKINGFMACNTFYNGSLYIRSIDLSNRIYYKFDLEKKQLIYIGKFK